MAHRALVYYRTDDSSTLHYSHRGEGLGRAIRPRRPFGGPAVRRPGCQDDHWGTAISTLVDRLGFDRATGYTPLTRVDPRPLARDVDPETVVSAIDETIESLVVVDRTYDTTTYLVCGLGLDGGGPLVLVGPTEDEGAVREWFVAAKSGLSERVDGGEISAETGRRWLRRGLATRGPVHAPDDASFLRRD